MRSHKPREEDGMKLYFQNSQGKERVIADVENDQQAMKAINDFCAERDFKIYYTRVWEEEADGKRRMVYDVSSHSEFFFLDLE